MQDAAEAKITAARTRYIAVALLRCHTSFELTQKAATTRFKEMGGEPALEKLSDAIKKARDTTIPKYTRAIEACNAITVDVDDKVVAITTALQLLTEPARGTKIKELNGAADRYKKAVAGIGLAPVPILTAQATALKDAVYTGTDLKAGVTVDLFTNTKTALIGVQTVAHTQARADLDKLLEKLKGSVILEQHGAFKDLNEALAEDNWTKIAEIANRDAAGLPTDNIGSELTAFKDSLTVAAGINQIITTNFSEEKELNLQKKQKKWELTLCVKLHKLKQDHAAEPEHEDIVAIQKQFEAAGLESKALTFETANEAFDYNYPGEKLADNKDGLFVVNTTDPTADALTTEKTGTDAVLKRAKKLHEHREATTALKKLAQDRSAEFTKAKAEAEQQSVLAEERLEIMEDAQRMVEPAPAAAPSELKTAMLALKKAYDNPDPVTGPAEVTAALATFVQKANADRDFKDNPRFLAEIKRLEEAGIITGAPGAYTVVKFELLKGLDPADSEFLKVAKQLRAANESLHDAKADLAKNDTEGAGFFHKMRTEVGYKKYSDRPDHPVNQLWKALNVLTDGRDTDEKFQQVLTEWGLSKGKGTPPVKTEEEIIFEKLDIQTGKEMNWELLADNLLPGSEEFSAETFERKSTVRKKAVTEVAIRLKKQWDDFLKDNPAGKLKTFEHFKAVLHAEKGKILADGIPGLSDDQLNKARDAGQVNQWNARIQVLANSFDLERKKGNKRALITREYLYDRVLHDPKHADYFAKRGEKEERRKDWRKLVLEQEKKGSEGQGVVYLEEHVHMYEGQSVSRSIKILGLTADEQKELGKMALEKLQAENKCDDHEQITTDLGAAAKDAYIFTVGEGADKINVLAKQEGRDLILQKIVKKPDGKYGVEPLVKKQEFGNATDMVVATIAGECAKKNKIVLDGSADNRITTKLEAQAKKKGAGGVLVDKALHDAVIKPDDSLNDNVARKKEDAKVVEHTGKPFARVAATKPTQPAPPNDMQRMMQQMKGM